MKTQITIKPQQKRKKIIFSETFHQTPRAQYHDNHKSTKPTKTNTNPDLKITLTP